MKKSISVLLAVLLAFSMLGITASAAAGKQVYVTIADAQGNIAVAYESVTVTDADSDGSLTISDAFYCAHESFYDGGAAAGYATETTQWGLGLKKLWGTANGGSYGYYLNNASAWSLADKVSDGDYVYGFVYTDTDKLSDQYSFFSEETKSVSAYKSFEVTLSCLEYDQNWNQVKKPVAGAKITVDGKTTSYVTDENGMASVVVAGKGEHIISAVSDSQTITPAVCKINAAGGSVIDMLVYYFNIIIRFVTGIFKLA